MRNIFLLFNTLRYLKWQQIFFRILRLFIKPKVTDRLETKNSNPKRSKTWIHHTLYDEKIDNQLEACFLNFSKKLNLPFDWNNKSNSKLWTYNLHYFENLLSNNSLEKINLHQELLTAWVDENPIGSGAGWEPYPSSLRIVNILKAWLGGLELDKKLTYSVFTQASFLSNNLEKHLLGNHYFVNLKALLFAGVVFENARLLSIGEKGLVSEIPIQILEDGANFELTPMYHSLMLVDMLDILNLCRAYPEKVSLKLASLLEEFIPKMLTFMDTMSHPDGGVSFFNDSVDGIAPKKSKIENYAKKLGFEVNSLDLVKPQIIDNNSSGYICATARGNKIIFDASSVGPDYIPGHAHADTLSFELSIGPERVFVNSGISEYDLNPMRLQQRKTKAHNTVEVDSKDSSQVWSSFRVAKRASILEKTFSINEKGRIFLQASHDGYKSKFSGCIHKRSLTFENNQLIVNDFLKGNYRSAKSFFHFHPDLDLDLKKNKLEVEGEDFFLFSDLNKFNSRVNETLWHPEFGISISNKTLEIVFDHREIEVVFNWLKK